MLVVQKFGGTSVADLARIRACAARSLRLARDGHQVVVVVSAMAGETNRLIGLANELVGYDGSGKGPYVSHAKAGDTAHERELDQLLATGEQASAALFAMAVQSQGGSAVSLVGRQIGMVTDGAFTRARIRGIRRERIDAELSAGRIVVAAGFQGVDASGNVTTLGRGGSDTSAVALAAALGADVCEILTDVDGVYTTDPRLVPSARKIDRITHEEMIELASLGAKVLQIRSVAFARRFGVPVHVRSSLHEREGTWIVPESPEMEAPVVSGVALDRNEAKVTVVGVPDVPGTVATIFGALGDAGIVVDMIIQNASRDGITDVTFTVPEADLERAAGILTDLRIEGRPLQVVTDPRICKISIVGLGMRTHAGVASRAFRALAAEKINVEMVSTSEIKVSVVVHERYGELALRVLHEAFGLGEAPDASG
ncbi:MAG: aspartate kinase [Deltaproteobacteria bacterium]|nr:MAG: aspartate kinase [Deltaproteobacteria bacterium]